MGGLARVSEKNLSISKDYIPSCSRRAGSAADKHTFYDQFPRIEPTSPIEQPVIILTYYRDDRHLCLHGKVEGAFLKW